MPQQTGPSEVFVGTTHQTDKIDPLFALFNEGTTLPEFFSALFYTALAVGATLAVLRLGYAGFLYMGGDSWGSLNKAKGIIQDVVLGLLLLLSVWVILNQINPDILNLDILQSVNSENTAPTNNGSTFTN